MKVKTVYILFLIEETKDEVRDKIYAVFSTREEAEEQGKGLVSLTNNNYISHRVINYAFFE